MDQRQIQRRVNRLPEVPVALTATHRQLRIELVPALGDALEQGTVVGVVSLHLVARQHAGEMLALVAFRAHRIGRHGLPGLQNSLGVKGAVGTALLMGET